MSGSKCREFFIQWSSRLISGALRSQVGFNEVHRWFDEAATIKRWRLRCPTAGWLWSSGVGTVNEGVSWRGYQTTGEVLMRQLYVKSYTRALDSVVYDSALPCGQRRALRGGILMSDVSYLPLTFLYTRGNEPVEGETRFQKLVFLAQQEEDDVPEVYEFEADNYGPYSRELANDLDRLVQKRMVNRIIITNSSGNKRYDYQITSKGRQQIDALYENDKMTQLLEAVTRIKKEFNNRRLDDLLRHVYRQFEDYTIETALDVDQLMDPDTESQFLKTDADTEYLGHGPGAWKTVNPSADELFSSE